jgi:tRNA A37 N6-isopentenylltransferase MiaA
MKTKKVIAELKQLYKKDQKLAIEAANALGFKIIAKVEDNEERVASEIKTLYKKDSKLAMRVAKILGYKIEAAGW